MAMHDDVLRVAAHWSSPLLVMAPTRSERAACARFVHENGSRRSGPFVAIRCEGDRIVWIEEQSSPLSPGLPAPDSVADWLGRAPGGTLFIDDVASLSQTGQAQLHWSLREGVLEDAAGDRIRVIAGSSGPLETDVAAGRFRAALFYRLNVIRVDLTAGTDAAP